MQFGEITRRGRYNLQNREKVLDRQREVLWQPQNEHKRQRHFRETTSVNIFSYMIIYIPKDIIFCSSVFFLYSETTPPSLQTFIILTLYFLGNFWSKLELDGVTYQSVAETSLFCSTMPESADSELVLVGEPNYTRSKRRYTWGGLQELKRGENSFGKAFCFLYLLLRHLETTYST